MGLHSRKYNINLENTETVYNEADLKSAMAEQYGKIIVTGEIAKKIYKNIDNNPKLRKLSNLSIVLGIFLWPLLLVGITGKILTATDFKNYKVTSYSEDELVLEWKNK